MRALRGQIMGAFVRLTRNVTTLKHQISDFIPASPKWSHGWRLTAVAACIATSFVFLTNLIILIWYMKAEPTCDGVKALYCGSCDRAGNMDTVIHLFINVFATILVGGSNLCMQQLCAPTRAEVDRAHRKKQWLDIGTQSFRNLRHVSRKRSTLWIVLALSSCPLHLFYNSAIYQQRASYDGHLYIAEQGSSESVMPTTLAPLGNNSKFYDPAGQISSLRRNWGSLGQLDRQACNASFRDLSSAGGVTRRSNAGDVVLVVSRMSASFQNMLRDDNFQCEWMDNRELVYQAARECYMGANCGLPLLNCSLPADELTAYSDLQYSARTLTTMALKYSSETQPWHKSEWSPISVLGCLERRMVEKCRLRISQSILVIVCIANAIKLICMLLTIWDDAAALVMVGDYIKSLLLEPDTIVPQAIVSGRETTRSRRSKPSGSVHNARKAAYQSRRWRLALRWTNRNYMRIETISVALSLFCQACFVFSCGICMIAVLIMANKEDNTWQFMASNKISTANLAPDVGNGILQNALCANLPQLILTQLYMAYNNLFTRKAVAHEWNKLAIRPSALRVTDPKPDSEQRSSYYLGLPYRFALPLQIISATLHWLISQSLFVTCFVVFGSDGAAILIDHNGATTQVDENGYANGVLLPPRLLDPNVIAKEGANQFVRVSYSCSALVAFVVLAFCCFFFGVADDARTVRLEAPRIKSCTAAIAACCGKIPLSKEQVCGKLQWGITAFKKGVAVCGFVDDADCLCKPEDGDLLADKVLRWRTWKWEIEDVPEDILMETRSFSESDICEEIVGSL